MIGMGMTLSADDFLEVLKKPKVVGFGVACQFICMPLAALASSRIFKLPPALALGLILVGTCPGGTASNLVTLISNASVPLSVLMTSTSTILATILTPTLTKLLTTSSINVDGFQLFKSTASVVLLPITLGMVLNKYLPRLSKTISSYTPFTSVILVSLICGSVVASNSSILLTSGLPVILSVLTLHSLGFFLGYFFPSLQGYSKKTCRTISIETGMQNSALAVVLAGSLGVEGAMVPGAVSATVHSCIGSALGGIWRWRDQRKKE
ncbi:hypothetical protein TrVE_jg9087 [Triparma verrucosa]|uniref:Uncharacterized protein n=1 Tax=Triparma verrucosa TaxID=1606542 RepID=A0A9W7BXA0_9STRA|nr:hypothetical protein TrVE_jg9087 [Triparma verrucosa]